MHAFAPWKTCFFYKFACETGYEHGPLIISMTAAYKEQICCDLCLCTCEIPLIREMIATSRSVLTDSLFSIVQEKRVQSYSIKKMFSWNANFEQNCAISVISAAALWLRLQIVYLYVIITNKLYWNIIAKIKVRHSLPRDREYKCFVKEKLCTEKHKQNSNMGRTNCFSVSGQFPDREGSRLMYLSSRFDSWKFASFCFESWVVRVQMYIQYDKLKYIDFNIFYLYWCMMRM